MNDVGSAMSVVHTEDVETDIILSENIHTGNKRINPMSNLLNLPDHILLLIFKFLDQSSLCFSSMVCKKLKSITSLPEFWNSLIFKGNTITQETVAKCFKLHPNASELTLTEGVKKVDKIVAKANAHLKNLQILNVYETGTLEGYYFEIALSKCVTLQKLSIYKGNYVSTNFAMRGFVDLSHPNLRSIRLECGFVKTSSLNFTCPLLETLSLKEMNGIFLLNLACPDLMTLDLTSCPNLSDINTFPASLQHLNIVGCGRLNKQTIQRISQCANLRSLRFVDCKFASNLSLSNRLLESLLLDQCENLQTVELHCVKMESCSVKGCEKLQSLKAHCGKLESISIISCVCLKTLELHCENLHRLDIQRCGMLVNMTIGPIGLRSLNLGSLSKLCQVKIASSCMTSLELAGCVDISNVTLQCPEMQSIDAFGCRNLTNKFLESISSSCSQVQSLSLAHCISMQPDVLLMQSELPCLQSLDLSYTFIERLSLIVKALPLLQTLKLVACKKLMYDDLDIILTENGLADLKELDVSFGNFESLALASFLRNCPKLTQVNLTGSAKLYNLNFSNAIFLCQKNDINKDIRSKSSLRLIPHYVLQTLNCPRCTNLREVVMGDAFSELLAFNLSHCSNLLKVQVAGCLKLETLNLDSCTALHVVKTNKD